MNELLNFTNTLFNLHSQIKFAVTTLERVYENKNLINSIKYDNEYFDKQALFQTSINALISNNCIIMFSSFLDEYANFNSHNLGKEIEDRIEYVRRQNKPGIKRINKWKDIKNFRNHLAAHNFKINGKSFFSDEVKNLEYIIPNTISEKKLFLLITELICLNIRDEFPEILFYMDPENRMIDKMKIIGEEIDFEEESKVIHSQMR